MSNKPLVSVIMNCFNGEEYLHEAVSSVIKQTYENWEVMLITQTKKKFLKVITWDVKI